VPLIGGPIGQRHGWKWLRTSLCERGKATSEGSCIKHCTSYYLLRRFLNVSNSFPYEDAKFSCRLTVLVLQRTPLCNTTREKARAELRSLVTEKFTNTWLQFMWYSIDCSYLEIYKRREGRGGYLAYSLII